MRTPREIPIPYSPEMVRARRAGIKTNTRRVMSPQPVPIDFQPLIPSSDMFRYVHDDSMWGDCWVIAGYRIVGPWRCSYGHTGDLLWVREAWRTLAMYNNLPPRDLPHDAPIWYEADGPAPAQFSGGRYRHARFMMRWMSRGLDEVVEIRIERLNEITESDAIDEGIETLRHECKLWRNYSSPDGPDCISFTLANPIDSYRSLWESINGQGSWDANPWVWVVHFKVLMP